MVRESALNLLLDSELARQSGRIEKVNWLRIPLEFLWLVSVLVLRQD